MSCQFTAIIISLCFLRRERKTDSGTSIRRQRIEEEVEEEQAAEWEWTVQAVGSQA